MNILKRNNVHMQGDGDSVLFYAHGFGCNQNMWNRITPAFASTHRQVLFDYVGSGKSDLAAFNPNRYANLQGYAQDIMEVYDALDLHGNVTFVGHSVSGSIGLLASIARPELFNRLILVNPSPCFLNYPPDYLGGFEHEDLIDLLSLMDQNYLGWANYFAPIASGESNTGVISGELTDSFCSTDPIVARVFAKATFFADNRADLPLVSRPSLILQNSNDALASVEVGEYMRSNLHNSTLKILEVIGHCAHMSNPSLVIEAMREYFNNPPPSQ